MFLINSKLKGINLKKQRLFKLKYSKNIVSVSAPQNIVAPARAYIVSTHAHKGCFVYIALIFSKQNFRSIFFEFHKNPVSESRALAIEEDALSFVEDMGFDMQDVDISGSQNKNKEEIIQKTGIFYFPQPTGTIDLQPAAESLPADGVSEMLVESQPILDTDGDLVSDDTIFEIKISSGFVINPHTNEKGNPLLIPIKSGFLQFVIQSSTAIGINTIQAKSKSGNARGTSRIIFIPGEPSSSLTLTASQKECIADDATVIAIESNSITDSFGNAIADGTEFSVQCEIGRIIDSLSKESGQSIMINSRGSILKFNYKVGKKAGQEVIIVKSVLGSARGNIALTIVPGLPVGDVTLHSSPGEAEVGMKKPVQITSDVLHDKLGNVIDDSLSFTFRTDRGSFKDEKGSMQSELSVNPRKGKLSVEFLPGELAGTAQINLFSKENHQLSSLSLRIYAGAAEGPLSLFADPEEISADGSSTTTIATKKPILDSLGNVIEDDTPFYISVDTGSLQGLSTGGVCFSQRGHLSFDYLSPPTGTNAHVTVRDSSDNLLGSLTIPLKVLEPVGQIVMNASTEYLTASETDECDVFSDIIVNKTGNPVSDGTVIRLTLNRGNFVGFDGSNLGQKTEVITTDGIMSCRICGGTKSGELQLEASSVTGSAHGTLLIPMHAESPEGSIVLHTERKQIPADNKTKVWITSDPITDAYENIVDDGTMISVETDAGTLLADMADQTDEGYHVSTKNGIIRFQLQSETKVSMVQVTALSVDGFAMGTLDLEFVAGEPVGPLSLKCEPSPPFVAGGNLVRCMTEPLTDKNGNPITSIFVFQLSCENGVFFSEDNNTESTDVTLKTVNGCLNFCIKTGDKSGAMVISAQSTDCNISEKFDFELLSGIPAGQFDLYAEGDLWYVSHTSPYRLYSALITDSSGNTIADGTEFTVKTTPSSSIYLHLDSQPIKSQAIVKSDSGKINFWISSDNPGDVSISISSREGNATAELICHFHHQDPTGTITLIPETETAIADGDSPILIESDVIYNAVGKIVVDGCEFQLLVDNGYAFTNDVEKATTETIIVSEGGKLSFNVIPSPIPGTLHCSIQSRRGDASGECSIRLVPGFPSGNISLFSTKESMYCGDSTPILIQSEAILDSFENKVEDTNVIDIECKHGLLLATKTDEGKSQLAITPVQSKLQFFVKSGTTPLPLSITVKSKKGDASGTLKIEQKQAPLSSAIHFVDIPHEMIADGHSAIEIKSAELLDIFGNPIADNSEFFVYVQNGMGATLREDDPSDSFPVHSHNAQIRFYIFSPSESRTITVRVTSSDESGQGSIEIAFYRPLSQGKIALFSDRADKDPLLISDGLSLIDIFSGVILTDREVPVLADESFIVTTDGDYLLKKDRDDSGDTSLTVAPLDGKLHFFLMSPAKPGKVTVTVTSNEGKASGKKSFHFNPGVPTGTIEIIPSRELLYSGEKEPVEFRTNPICDSLGNIVSEDNIFHVALIVIDAESSSREVLETFELKPQNGILTFQFLPPKQYTRILISLSPEDDNATAHGEYALVLTKANPVGVITLIAQSHALVADGRNMTTITSEIIKNSLDDPIPDGEKFLIRADRGSITASQGEITENGLLISSLEGKISFALRASKKAGLAHITVKSVEGEAKGELDITFLPGEPSGNIILHAEPLHITADGESESIITSDIIVDNLGNTVADSHLVFIETDSGNLIDPSNPDQKGEPLSVPLNEGRFNVILTASKQAGVATLVAWSQVGNAIGNLEISMISGPPSGEIILLPSAQEFSTASEDFVTLTTLPIKDKYGNFISDNESFLVNIKNPGDENDIENTIKPKNGKLEIKVPPSPQPGDIEISVKSIDGNAFGKSSITCVEKELVTDEEDEWFFAEAEEDFFVDDSAMLLRKEEEELTLSIEDSFSRIISSDKSKKVGGSTEEKEKPILSKAQQQLIRFLAGF